MFGLVLNVLKSIVMSDLIMGNVIKLVELNLVPDFLVRVGIRSLLKTRVDRVPNDPEILMRHKVQFVQELKTLPIAVETKTSAEQHYEVPTDFYLASLGKRLKYSSAYYPPGCNSLVKNFNSFSFFFFFVVHLYFFFSE